MNKEMNQMKNDETKQKIKENHKRENNTIEQQNLRSQLNCTMTMSDIYLILYGFVNCANGVVSRRK